MSDCERCEILVSAWQDGELDRGGQEKVLDHLGRCAGRRDFYRETRGLAGLPSAVGKLSLEMGRIASIEKKGRGAAVQMRDGRKFELHGTNDVDSSIRGIFVEDGRYGRVKIPWEAFRRVDFLEGPATGPSFADYPPATPLRGTVTDRDGKSWKGRVIFDLDESESWEMLNGNRNGIEYNIPFERVRSVESAGDESSAVTLRDGTGLRLEEGQDVIGANAGLLVIPGGGEPEHYVPWDRVRRIDFE